jgi:hypothetical protein
MTVTAQGSVFPYNKAPWLTTEQRAHYAFLAQFYGSDHLYRHALSRGRVQYTDGVAEMAERFGSYWIIDLIASHQLSAKVRAEEFQHWVIRRDPRGSAAWAFVTDGNDGEDGPHLHSAIAQQRIPYTDLPVPELRLYLENGILMLPGER